LQFVLIDLLNMEPRKPQAEVIPLYGRDEMNLVEFPFGPITTTSQKTFVIDHPVFDRALKKEVQRKLVITGSDAFGLPRPIDDQVLMGLKALTYKAGFSSREVEFTRYQLCQLLGWPDDGRSYARIEESLDRIAGTTLKFKDSWWDKGDELWTSQTFHLIDNVSIATRNQIARGRLSGKTAGTVRCSFTWNEVIWKSFQDGFIKKVDMDMFRRIAKGKRKEVPLRLYRILDKRFHRRTVAKFSVRKLCVGTLGLKPDYCPTHMVRILKRASDWLIRCGYLAEMKVKDKGGELEAVFFKSQSGVRIPLPRKRKSTTSSKESRKDMLFCWFERQAQPTQDGIFKNALAYAKDTNTVLYQGYCRNKGGSADAEKGYVETIVTRYLHFCRKKKAETQAA